MPSIRYHVTLPYLVWSGLLHSLLGMHAMIVLYVDVVVNVTVSF